MPSHTALQSGVRLLVLSFLGQVGDAALQRLAVVNDINEERGEFE